ncbi:MAG: LptF/LptG family permease [Kiritimatiellia bacterium]
MRTIERYVFGSFLTSFFLSFLVLSFVLTIGLMVQIVGYILQGLPANLVGQFALVSFPETMQWTIPIGLLVSSILVFSRLSADSEIAAMRACGVNLLTVMRAPVLFAFGCTVLGFYVNNEIVPRGHEVRRDLARRISVGAGLEVLEPGHIIEDFPKAKIYFEAKEGNWLKDLIVLDYSNPKLDRLVTASKALVRSEGRDIVLDLHGMTIDPMDEDHPGMARAARVQYRVKDALKERRYNRREKDLRFFELLAAIEKNRQLIKNPDSYVAEQIRRKKARELPEADRTIVEKAVRKSLRQSSGVLKTELSKRWVFACASVCFVLIGVPLGIRAQRRESTIGMAISLVVALCYYLVVILMLSMAKRYSIHPEILIWLPVVLCGALAGYLVPKNL